MNGSKKKRKPSKEFGEVLTPIWLVEDMMDTLQPDIWQNPELKWLDPCVGPGAFIQVVVERLMKGLEWTIPNEEERYKHIMENMIYVCELQPKNVFLFMYAFDPEDKYALNIYNGSYLSEGFNKHMADLGVEKFDVIVMNPPYNKDSVTTGTGHTLWDKFVTKTIDELIDGGYLVAVHPSGWRNIDGTFKNIQNLLKSRQMLYLETHNEKDGLKVFGAETRYDFYCLQNVPCTVSTKIKCQDGTIERSDISKMEFIPNGKFKMIEKLTAKPNEECVNTLHSHTVYAHRKPHMSKEYTEEFRFPCIYTVKNGDKLRLIYSNTTKFGHFNIPKLVWSNGRIISVGTYIDANGDYGLTEFSYGIIDDPENLPYIKRAFDNKDFRSLMEACAISDMSINKKIISTFRKDFWKEFQY